MPQTKTTNRRIVLHSRPKGAPTPENFRTETAAVPVPAPGEVLLRTIWLSLDPYMRGRMSDAPSYAAPVELGGVMVGGTVSRVVSSSVPAFRDGDLVLSNAGWQDYAVSDGTDLMPLAVSRSKVRAFCKVTFELERFFQNFPDAQKIFPLKINNLNSIGK
ncbi:oxidoreductase, zinc-binding dehydrogenase family protein [Burkholderia pseudomallei]|nr:oxidoreductase, zinc-binding dehydrogenase family protein [Burkholderia pseudomallei]